MSGCSTNPVDKLSDASGKTHFAHNHWKVSLPGKWLHENDEGAFIASSESRQYALYITVYGISTTESTDNWAAEEIKNLKSIKYVRRSYKFELPTELSFKQDNQIHYVIDGRDLKNKMRLYSKGILSGNKMYTISFHDYNYSDQLESEKVLKAILEYLEVKT